MLLLSELFLGLLARCFITLRSQRAILSLGNGLLLWPTGLIVMVAYGHEHDFFGYAVTAISIVLNIALYAAAVMLLWFVVRMIVRRLATTKR
jgi:uncharacterized membrane-anchored protein